MLTHHWLDGVAKTKIKWFKFEVVYLSISEFEPFQWLFLLHASVVNAPGRSSIQKRHPHQPKLPYIDVWILVYFKTQDQFEMDGCDNCDKFLHMKNNRDRVDECTSTNFDG